MSTAPDTYGLLAEFQDTETLVEAVRRTREGGYTRIDAYSPFPVEELPAALGFRRTRMPAVVLCGGVIGFVCAYALQYWVSAVEYPLNIGGRPLNSWPAFFPVMFELTVLVASLFAVLGMFALNKLPQPYHPLFNVPRFARATQDAFFLCIEADDPNFHPETTRRFLEDLEPVGIHVVPK